MDDKGNQKPLLRCILKLLSEVPLSFNRPIYIYISETKLTCQAGAADVNCCAFTVGGTLVHGPLHGERERG